ETHHRYTILMYDVVIDIAKSIFVWNLLAAARETYIISVPGVDEIFKILSVAFVLTALAAKRADARHMEAAANLDVVTPRELFVLGVPQPPRYVDMHAAHAVRVVTRQFLQGGDVCAECVADAIRQIPSDVPGSVCE